MHDHEHDRVHRQFRRLMELPVDHPALFMAETLHLVEAWTDAHRPAETAEPTPKGVGEGATPGPDHAAGEGSAGCGGSNVARAIGAASFTVFDFFDIVEPCRP